MAATAIQASLQDTLALAAAAAMAINRAPEAQEAMVAHLALGAAVGALA